MRYSQEFIDNLVARILSKELRISEASVQLARQLEKTQCT